MMHNNKIRMAAPNTVVVRNVPVVYKRIRLQDSDSDDAASPAKKPTVTVELTTAVKERRFRNMLEMFPDISPIVSNVLYSYTFLGILCNNLQYNAQRDSLFNTKLIYIWPFFMIYNIFYSLSKTH